MREQSRDIERLRHIVDSIAHIEDFLRGKTIDQMKDDVMCYHAVVYNIMIIGVPRQSSGDTLATDNRYAQCVGTRLLQHKPAVYLGDIH